MGLLLDKLKQLELGPPAISDGSEEPSASSYSSWTTTHESQDHRNSPTAADSTATSSSSRAGYKAGVKFPDLDQIPPELSLQILKYLNATDLCLAACVWSSLANDDILWQSLCRSTWGYASIYNKKCVKSIMDAAREEASSSSSDSLSKTFRSIFMHLDEATLTFNADWKKGMEYLIKQNLVDDDPFEIAKFINSTKKLNAEQKEKLFKEKPAVLENVIILHNYENQFLPTALRRFFAKIEAPKERNSYLSMLLEKFSKRFCSCNPQLELSEDAVYILCFSLILLSVDLTSPAVKNKMSKREFIRNTRNALPNLSPDFTGHLYDNVYLNGSIAKASRLDDDLVRVR